MVEVAQRAEELGYASLWAFQRLLSPLAAEGGTPMLEPQYRRVDDPLATLAFLAGHTSAARLGVAVVNIPYYSPVVLAKSVATIDRLSDGRLDVGLGLGWLAQEMEAVGVTASRRGARAEDFLRCLQAIWTDEVVEYAGPFYRVPRSVIEPKPVQTPHPPVLLGGTAAPALARAGRLAAGWISSSRADLSRIAESVAVVRQAAAGAGRNPHDQRLVCRAVVKVRERQPEGPRPPLSGSVDEIRSDLQALAGAGVTEAFIDLNFDPEIGSPAADAKDSMRRAHQVLEALAPD